MVDSTTSGSRSAVLKDFPRPAHLYQLDAEGLPTQFPPPQTPTHERPIAALSVVIADDSMLVREGLRRLLTENGCEVAAAVPNAPALHRAVAETDPDAVLLDIRMPPTRTSSGAHGWSTRSPR